jgi:hypothetical protein
MMEPGLFGLNFLLRNFRHITWIYGSAWMTEIFKKTNLRSVFIYGQTHIVHPVRVSGEAFGKGRPATAFDQLPVNAEHRVNYTLPGAIHREAHASKFPCRSSACDKVLFMK